MNNKPTIWILLTALFAISAAQLPAQEPKKLALLIGVEEYDKRGFPNLKYAEDDMSDLAKQLRAAGFEVGVLLGSNEGSLCATRSNIDRAINQQFIPRLKKLNKQDIVLIAMAGHGRHSTRKDNNREDHFYCPRDAHDTDPATWFSITDLLGTLEKESGSERNLILVDACRDNPSRGRGVDGKGFSLGRDSIAVLFASSYGEQAYEPDSLRHGIFTYYVMKALSGEAKNFDDEVTWDSLVDFVRGRVAKKSSELKEEKEIDRIQQPNSVSNLRGRSPVLVKIDPAQLRPALLKAPFSAAEAQDRIAQWVRFKNLPSSDKTGPADIQLQLVPPGEYQMGSKESADEIMAAFSDLKNLKRENYTDAPQHRVQITRPVWMGRYEVTFGQFQQFVDETKYRTDAERDGEGGWGYDAEEKKHVGRKPEFTWRQTGFEQTAQHPVVNISWNDSIAFCNWLSRQSVLTDLYDLETGKLKPGLGYRLPTEAEWEYACRAGTTTRYQHGDDPEGLVNVGNTWDASTKEKFPTYINRLKGTDRFPFTSVVGRFRSNRFGLCDLHGNVWEWCNDHYSSDYYATSPLRDPAGPGSGSSRVLRGGGWLSLSTVCRSAYRFYFTPADRSSSSGFRVVLSVD